MENCNLEENGKICISRRYILDEFLDLSLKVPWMKFAYVSVSYWMAFAFR